MKVTEDRSFGLLFAVIYEGVLDEPTLTVDELKYTKLQVTSYRLYIEKLET
jgi:hypothetical protein